MCSAIAPGVTDDRTARARIRDVAIELFGNQGVDGVSLRAVAAQAGVSSPLVVHHFGSKLGLLEACDHHVAASIRERKLEAVAQGAELDVMGSIRDAGDNSAAMRYLTRRLVDGSPEVTALVDELVDDAVEYSEEAVRTGMMVPSEWPRERAVVLTLWSLGMLVLHDHVERLLGVDLFGDPAQFGPYVLPVSEVLGRGAIAEELYERIRDEVLAGREGAT